jgi:hypothetical protein
MINLNNYTTAAAAFEKISAMTRQSIDSNDQSCVFQSLLCCLSDINPLHTHDVASLRKATECLHGPLPFQKIILLGKLVNVNILVIVHDNTFTSGSSFFPFVHDVEKNYIILHWDNTECHTEPYCKDNHYKWSKLELYRLKIDQFFNLENCSKIPNQYQFKNFRRPTHSLHMSGDNTTVDICVLNYVSYSARKQAGSPVAKSTNGKFYIKFINNTGHEEFDYISSDDDSMQPQVKQHSDEIDPT